MHRAVLPFALLFIAAGVSAQQPATVFTNVEYWTCPEERLPELEAAIDSIWGPIFDEMTQEGHFVDWHSQRPVGATRLNRTGDGLERTSPAWQWVLVWSTPSEEDFDDAWREMVARLAQRFPDDPRPTRFCDDLTIVRYEGTPSPAPAPLHPALPALTPEQRWNRAAQFADVNLLASLGFAKQEGRLDAFVEHLERIYPPTWRNRGAPSGLMRGMYRNYASYPHLEFEVLDVSDDRARFRMNRPWERTFGERQELYGASASDVEEAMERVAKAIAAHLGFTWEQRRDGDWTEVAISRMPTGSR